jgi:hypothetical protein
LIGDNSFTKIVQNCPLLENIFLGALNLSDLSLVEISKSCPSIKNISLPNASKFTDNGLEVKEIF